MADADKAPVATIVRHRKAARNPKTKPICQNLANPFSKIKET